MRPVYYFRDKYERSRAWCEEDQIVTLLGIIPECESVHKTDTIEDRNGVDFVATLANGKELFIDAKVREPRCSRHWRGGPPQLALETWSKKPGGKFHTPPDFARIGWTLDPSKKADLILYTFDPSDSIDVFLLPFDHLQMAFTKYRAEWAKTYKTDTQESDSWESECMFVPEPVVFDAIYSISHGGLVLVDRNEPSLIHQISLDEAWDDVPF